VHAKQTRATYREAAVFVGRSGRASVAGQPAENIDVSVGCRCVGAALPGGGVHIGYRCASCVIHVEGRATDHDRQSETSPCAVIFRHSREPQRAARRASSAWNENPVARIRASSSDALDSMSSRTDGIPRRPRRRVVDRRGWRLSVGDWLPWQRMTSAGLR
jgi:hypothetical protein